MFMIASALCVICAALAICLRAILRKPATA